MSRQLDPDDAALQEIFRITLCLVFPVACGLIYANPKVMKSLLTYYNFVQYPAEVGKMIPPEEMIALVRKREERERRAATEEAASQPK